MNTQPISKPVHNADGVLEVHSIFYTIQGEGPFCGRSAVFVRLWGCNLQCPGCDTEYTATRESVHFTDLLRKVKAAHGAAKRPIVVITGGEPLRQNLTPFVRSLVTAGYDVQIETNGTLPLSPGLENYASTTVDHDVDPGPSCYIVCSPKAGKVNKLLEPYILAYKYVGDDKLMEDGLPKTALDHTAHPHVARPHATYRGVIYLQPMDAHNEEQSLKNAQACIASVMEHGYTLQVQVHKVISVE